MKIGKVGLLRVWIPFGGEHASTDFRTGFLGSPVSVGILEGEPHAADPSEEVDE